MTARKSRAKSRYRAAQKAHSVPAGGLAGEEAEVLAPKTKKLSPAQMRAAHAAVATRTHPHAWLGALFLAAALGAATVALSGVSVPDTNAGVMLAVLGIAGASVATGVLTLVSADLVLGGRGWAETWRWAKSTEDARAVITANTIIPAAIALIARVGYPPAAMPYEALLIIGVFIAVWRSLSLAYRHQYLDRTLSANARLFLDAGRTQRARWKRVVFFVFGARALQERHRLILPFLQSYLVLTASQLSLIFYFPQGVNEWIQALAVVSFPILLVVSVWVWGRWHLFGGLGAVWSQVTGAETGRPLRPNV